MTPTEVPLFLLWSLGALAATIFCVVHAIADVRAGKIARGLFGLISIAVVMLTPIKTHAVKIDLPAAR